MVSKVQLKKLKAEVIKDCRKPNNHYNSYGESLRFDGFRVFRSDDEEWLFIRAGPEFMLQLYDAAHRYATLEAEYFRKMSHTNLRADRQAFKELCDYKRHLAILDAANALGREDISTGTRDGVPVMRAYSDKEMLTQIAQEYLLSRIEQLNTRHHKKKDK